MPYLDRLRLSCSRNIACSPHRLAARLFASVSQPTQSEDETEESFRDHAAELRRRKKRIDEKRRQHVRACTKTLRRGADVLPPSRQGSTFVDHMIVSVRGGSGGNGAAAFTPTKSSATGPPSGGNGGQGGSVYFTSSPHLTSLSTVPKRIRGGPGLNGSGAFKHGRRGVDTVIALPVGTIVKELRRDDLAVQAIVDEANSGLDEEEQARIRRERWFVKHPTGEVGEEDYEDAEAVLYREGRLPSRGARKAMIRGDYKSKDDTPIELDIDKPIPMPILISQGGLGGLGNPHFFNSAKPHRAPRLASKGLQPSTITLSLELKLLADVGLVGFPNAGKSTILRGLTGSKAEVAGYQFTTLNPQVGVVRFMDDGSWRGGIQEGGAILESWEEREREQRAMESGDERQVGPARLAGSAGTAPPAIERLRFTMSDNPGLLPMASENYGLGHSFLRSIERSLALAYVLDLTRPQPGTDLLALRKELEAYKPGLAAKGRVVIVNKGDEVDAEVGRERVADVRRQVEALRREGDNLEVVTVSAKFGLGLDRVVRALADLVEQSRREAEAEAEA